MTPGAATRSSETGRIAVVLGVVFLLAVLIYLPRAGVPALLEEGARLMSLAGGTSASALSYQEHPDEARPLANLIAHGLLTVTGTLVSLRVVSALLHGVNAALLLVLGARLRKDAGGADPLTLAAPAAGAMIFLAHPLASEALLSHAAFPLVLGTTFGLAMLVLEAGGRARGNGLGPALYLAALLCDASLWPMVLPAIALASRRGGDRSRSPSRARILLPYAASLLLFYACWSARQWPSLNFVPAVTSPGWSWSLASFFATVPGEARLILFPWGGLAVDHGDVAFAGSWNTRAILGIVVIAALIAAAAPAARRRSPFGLAMTLIAGLHLHWIIAPPSEPLQERRFYALLAALGLALGGAAGALERRVGARATVAAAALLSLALGVAAMQRGRLWDDPLALWESAADLSPGSPRAHVVVADLRFAKGETDTALQEYEAALARAPKSASIQHRISEVYLKKGDYVRAVQEADKAMRLDASYFPAYITAGNAFMLRERPRDAFLAFNAAMRLRPNDPSALYNMGNLLYDQGRYDQASELLKKAAEARPDDADIHFRLGLSRVMVGDADGAMQALRTCLQIAPGRSDAKINLASILTQSHQHDEARQLLEEALEAEPDNAKAMNGLAVLESTQDRWAEARTLFEKAAQKDPNDLRTLYNLAGAYERLGEKSLAADTYRKFLAGWKGSLEVSEDARARLAKLDARPPR